jgi:hypothetical protein
MRAFFTVSIMLLATAAACAEDPLVVLAAARAGHIDFFDAALAPISGISVNQVESVTASPDGRRLYVAQNKRTSSDKCCGLFSLDLEAHQMCLLAEPALFGAPSPDGRFLFTQGKTGVDVFDAGTLSRLSTMKAPGAYNLQPSPDGRWLFGVTNSPKPSLDIFDVNSGTLARRLPLPAGPVTGTWAGDRFYLFAYSDRGLGQLWSVKPQYTELSQTMLVALPDLHGACNEPLPLMLAGAPDRLFLAEAFGFKVDRRLNCRDAGDGIYVIHPSSGRVEHIAPSVRVNRMAVSPNGRDLYVIHSSDPGPQRNVRLLHIDIGTGRVLQNVALGGGDWNLALAHIPPALIPYGYKRSMASCSR